MSAVDERLLSAFNKAILQSMQEDGVDFVASGSYRRRKVYTHGSLVTERDDGSVYYNRADVTFLARSEGMPETPVLGGIAGFGLNEDANGRCKIDLDSRWIGSFTDLLTAEPAGNRPGPVPK